MKITIDMRMLNISGIGTYLKNLVPLLIEHNPQISFCLLGKQIELQAFDWTRQVNVSLVEINSSFYSIREQFELIAKIPKDTTLYWATHYNIPLAYRGKLLVTVYDLLHLAMPEYAPGLHKKIYAWTMFNAIKWKADNVLCISQFTADELQRLTGMYTEKMHPILLGVNRSWFQIQKKQNPSEHPYLLYVGNVKPHKNLSALLEAFEGLKEKIPHQLVIVGRRSGFITGDAALVEKADSLEGRVQFTDYIAHEEMEQYFVHADALVFPSIYEGFGLPPLEAMACGCPVVVSHSASLPEVCGESIIYFNPHSTQEIADAILKVLNDTKLRAKQIQQGKKHAQAFTWERTASKTWDVIEQTVNDYRPI